MDFQLQYFFVFLTIYAAYKLKALKNNLEREHKIRELQRLDRILKITGSTFSSVVLVEILSLGAVSEVVIPGIANCINIDKPSYIDNEQILRFRNDKSSKFYINKILYITKEALCYLMKKEGLVDLPIVVFEQIKIDGVYSFIKIFSEWTVRSIVTKLVL